MLKKEHLMTAQRELFCTMSLPDQCCTSVCLRISNLGFAENKWPSLVEQYIRGSFNRVGAQSTLKMVTW